MSNPTEGGSYRRDDEGRLIKVESTEAPAPVATPAPLAPQEPAAPQSAAIEPTPAQPRTKRKAP